MWTLTRSRFLCTDLFAGRRAHVPSDFGDQRPGESGRQITWLIGRSAGWREKKSGMWRHCSFFGLHMPLNVPAAHTVSVDCRPAVRFERRSRDRRRWMRLCGRHSKKIVVRASRSITRGRRSIKHTRGLFCSGVVACGADQGFDDNDGNSFFWNFCVKWHANSRRAPSGQTRYRARAQIYVLKTVVMCQYSGNGRHILPWREGARGDSRTTVEWFIFLIFFARERACSRRDPAAQKRNRARA